ncbi:hypothetical protein LGN06_07835 [Burkholderia vietnamiensis]|uniref:hypothetical protein n=1 Tax=Burkholderia vietnamiensis TaxID=60552 RepID=UPI001CF53E52|nr:hypothetical protein [Burkholderia vietnamiensis]MCA8391471.1 hypothetical protein [Burkholderia vietnamiensis]HDR8957062.1 hypothetical protein [Burkholderia vietnamiensis]HDR9243691.1 hypothetical protein [Burkholderia vietnamiensis]
MATQNGNVREFDDGPYRIVIAAVADFETVGNPPRVRGYHITTTIRRIDDAPVKRQFRSDVRHVDGTGLSLDEALNHGQRFVMALIEHGFPQGDDFWEG